MSSPASDAVLDNQATLTDPSTVPDKKQRTTSFSSSPTRDATINNNNKSNLDYLMLADSTLENIPPHLRQLLQQLGSAATKISSSEMLFLLIYVAALESGFITQKEWNKHKDIITLLTATSSFHSKNLMRLTKQLPTYVCNANKSHFTMQLRSNVNVHPTFLQSKSPKVLNTLLTALVTGDFMIVTLTPDSSTEASGHSLCLSIGRYVLNTLAKGKTLYMKFRKLDELSMMLRDSLFVPIRNKQLEMCYIHVYPSLIGLPSELYDEIFQYLNQNQLNILANVNRHLNSHCNQSKYFVETTKSISFSSISNGFN